MYLSVCRCVPCLVSGLLALDGATGEVRGVEGLANVSLPSSTLCIQFEHDGKTRHAFCDSPKLMHNEVPFRNEVEVEVRRVGNDSKAIWNRIEVMMYVHLGFVFHI